MGKGLSFQWDPEAPRPSWLFSSLPGGPTWSSVPLLPMSNVAANLRKWDSRPEGFFFFFKCFGTYQFFFQISVSVSCLLLCYVAQEQRKGLPPSVQIHTELLKKKYLIAILAFSMRVRICNYAGCHKGDEGKVSTHSSCITEMLNDSFSFKCWSTNVMCPPQCQLCLAKLQLVAVQDAQQYKIRLLIFCVEAQLLAWKWCKR